MEDDEAITRFAALATPSRLAVLKLIASAGEAGLASGEIARQLGVAHNTLSTQLLLLSNARLVKCQRDGRSVIYTANLEALSELIMFLVDDCAAGRLTSVSALRRQPSEKRGGRGAGA